MKNPTLLAIYAVCALSVVVFLAVTVSGCPAVRVSAEENEYLRVIDEETPFFADKTADMPLFYLPYTYYVRVLDGGTYYTHVEYAVKGSIIDGYVPTEKLFDDDLAVASPFPSVTLTTADNAVLYKDCALSSPLQYVFEGRNLYYYGKYLSPQGKTLYYVSYNDRLGYVKEEDLMPFALPVHPNELTFLAQKEQSPEPVLPKDTEVQSDEQSAFNIRIAIIAVLGLAGVIALIVALGKKPKPATAAGYYDENDYE